MKRLKLHRYILQSKGYIFVLFAIMIPLLLAMSALVVDIGYAYVAKANLQNAADAAALAGAAQLGDSSTDVNSVMKTYIQKNSSEDSTVTVSSSTSTDASIPDATGSIYGLTNQVTQSNNHITLRVTLGERVPTFFFKFFGFTTLPVAVVATAEYTPGASDEFGGLFDNAIYGYQNIYFHTTGIKIDGTIRTHGTITMDNNYAATVSNGGVLGFSNDGGVSNTVWGTYGWYQNQQMYYTVAGGTGYTGVSYSSTVKDVSLSANSAMQNYIDNIADMSTSDRQTNHIYYDLSGSFDSSYTNTVSGYTGITNRYDMNYTVIIVNGNIQANVSNTLSGNLILISLNGNITIPNTVAVNVWAYAPNGQVYVDGNGAQVTGSLVGNTVLFTSNGQQIEYADPSDSGNSSSSSSKGDVKLIDDNKYAS